MHDAETVPQRTKPDRSVRRAEKRPRKAARRIMPRIVPEGGVPVQPGIVRGRKRLADASGLATFAPAGAPVGKYGTRLDRPCWSMPRQALPAQTSRKFPNVRLYHLVTTLSNVANAAIRRAKPAVFPGSVGKDHSGLKTRNG